MSKLLGPLVGGIIIGAAAAEIIRKKYPNGLNELYRNMTRGMIKLYGKAAEKVSEAKEAFAEGYRSATHSPDPARAGT